MLKKEKKGTRLILDPKKLSGIYGGHNCGQDCDTSCGRDAILDANYRKDHIAWRIS